MSVHLNLNYSTSHPQPYSVFTFNISMFAYSYMTIVHSLSIFLLIRFHFLYVYSQTTLSMQLKTHMYTWLILSTFSLMYAMPVVYNLLTSGCLNFGSVIIAPLSTTFITLDRIFAIVFPFQTNRRRYFQLTTIFILVLSFIIVFLLGFYRIYTPNKSTTDCLLFACLIDSNVKDVLTFKMIVSWSNVFLGGVFVMIYYRFKKTLSNKQKKKSNFVTWIVFEEFIFTIFPIIVYLFFQDDSGSYLSTLLSTMMSLTHSTDSIFTSIVYYLTLSEVLKPQMLNKRAVGPVNVRTDNS